MRKITVILIEPDPIRRAHFHGVLSRETNLLLVDGQAMVLVKQFAASPQDCDVVLIDIDATPAADTHLWASIHVTFPAAHIIALTNGGDDRQLESALAAGLTGLFRPDCESTTLVSALELAARGIISFDRGLIEHARQVLLAPPTPAQIRLGGLTLDLATNEVTRWGQHIHLTPLEFRVLAYLAQRTGRATDQVELLTSIWFAPLDRGGTLAQVQNCIKRIRKKIEPDIKHPRYLLSERGRGYWLQDPTVEHPTTSLGAQRGASTASIEANLASELIDI